MARDALAARMAIAATLEHLTASLPGAWTRWSGGAMASVTGAQADVLNVVLAVSGEADDGSIDGLLEEIAATGLPHSLQVPARDGERVASLAEAHGMTAEEPLPLMVQNDLSSLTESDHGAAGLEIRQLAPDQASLHAEVAAKGFEAPIGPMLHVTAESVLAAPGVRCYVGEADGQAVVTGMGVTVGSHAGVLTVATLAQFRRRGYGAAVTARALGDARLDGASWAWLQSSQAGFGVYQRLGFQALERMAGWRSDGTAPAA